MDAISDAKHDWQNTQFLHVFQEQLITGYRNSQFSLNEKNIGLLENEMDAMVDLQKNADFEEPFYLVVLEKTRKGTTIHQWRIVIASEAENTEDMTDMFMPDSNLVRFFLFLDRF